MRAPINKYTITNLNLRKEPSKSATIITVIPAYSRFELIDSESGEIEEEADEADEENNG